MGIMTASGVHDGFDENAQYGLADKETDMARIHGLEPREAGSVARFIYAMVRRKTGQITGMNRLVEPVRITAHHPRLLIAYGQMEMGQESAHTAPVVLKSLASMMAARLIGCPF
jgi:hypothetical protein